MTDHADTIRRSLDVMHDASPAGVNARLAHGRALDALDALLAERQQAQEDAEKWEREALRCGDSLARVERERRHGETRGERDAVSMTTHEQRLYAAQEKLLTRIEQLKAERQQLQEQLKEWELIAVRTAAGVEDVKKLDVPSRESLLAQRQQAIDALREAHNRLLVIECDARYEDGNIEQAQKIEALLQKLGETP